MERKVQEIGRMQAKLDAMSETLERVLYERSLLIAQMETMDEEAVRLRTATDEARRETHDLLTVARATNREARRLRSRTISI